MMGGTESSSQVGQEPKKKLAMLAPQEALSPNDFVYGKLLGLGSYSKVVKAKRKDTGQIYALKIMDKKHIIRENKVKFVKMERIILDQLDFPDMGLECCTGGELFDQIRRKRRISEVEVRFYTAEIVDILEYIHAEGVVHRDLKPENLLITAEGHLKLCDFGSAKMFRPLPNGFFQPEDGESSSAFVGTAEYVSPEVLNGKPVDHAVDLWALGCTVYQMLEGRPPFKAGTEYLTFQKVLARDIVMPSHFSREAEDLVDRLLVTAMFVGHFTACNIVITDRHSSSRRLIKDMKPDQRLGAQGYDEIRSHPFFNGFEWSRERRMPAPELTKDVTTRDLDGSPEVWKTGLADVFDAAAFERSSSESSLSEELASDSRMESSADQVQLLSPACLSDSSASRLLTDTKSQNTTLTDDCNLEKWYICNPAVCTEVSEMQNFVEHGEALVATGLVKNCKLLVSKKLQLLLLNKPRLVLVEPEKLTVVVEVSDFANTKVKVEDANRFKVITPTQTLVLEDLAGQAWQWKKVVEYLQKRS